MEKEERDKLIDHMFISLDSPNKELTKWEEDFLASIYEQWEVRRWLSEKQYEILDRIYAEKTS